MYTNTFITKYGNMTCFANDIVFNSELKNGKIYEEELIKDNIIPLFHNKNKEKNVILDIGSHIGSHTLIYSNLIKNSQIFAFEPQKEIFNLLEKNVNDNNLQNVKIFNNAVGHYNMDAYISNMLYDGYNCIVEYNTHKTFNYGGIGLGEYGEPTKMVTIDSLNLDSCDYIKIDVEGAEILVLIGGVNTITNFKPYIWFEKTDKIVTDEMKRSLNIDFELPNIFEFLNNIGYKFKPINNDNYLAYI
jgi:FkbM family methyltransferase